MLDFGYGQPPRTQHPNPSPPDGYLLVGVVRAAYQRPGLDVQEPELIRHGFQIGELLRGHVALDRQVLPTGELEPPSAWYVSFGQAF